MPIGYPVSAFWLLCYTARKIKTQERSANMKIDEFLLRVVDGYLLHDLENMATFTTQVGTVGAMGYPMLVSTLAGMELLGNLLMPNTDLYLCTFWARPPQAANRSYKESG